MTLDEAIAKLVALREVHGGDVEFRVTRPADIEDGVNTPAADVTYHEFGPLKYVEIV